MYTLILSVFYLYLIQVNTYVHVGSLLSYDSKIRVFLKDDHKSIKTLNFGESGVFSTYISLHKKNIFLEQFCFVNVKGIAINIE